MSRRLRTSQGATVELHSDVLSLERDDHVATLWLNRPDARNAMGRAFWRDLPLACAALQDDEEVRVVVVAARGTDFSVGLDLKEMGGDLVGGDVATSPARANERTYGAVRAMQGALQALADLRVPVIAAVHGWCIGGGVDLISACDIRLAAGDATFSLREVKVAIVADVGSLQRLPAIIGAGHLAQLALTGEDIDAARARRIGLVNDVHGASGSDVLDAARRLASAVAANSPWAVRGTKAILRHRDERRIADELDFVARWNTMYLRTNDLGEAITAFLEHREPVFRGD
ncbi:MAG: crotonase/enoyl-CoA hydratase family protein [Acidimicrobiales bacterium]